MLPAVRPEIARPTISSGSAVASAAISEPAARLQIDATSVYGAEVLGLDPKKTTYSELDSPYNGSRHAGLPPTPISTPGKDALLGAVDPADGNWRYYVNGDKAGHLFFTDSEAAFAKAVATCRQNNWGCA